MHIVLASAHSFNGNGVRYMAVGPFLTATAAAEWAEKFIGMDPGNILRTPSIAKIFYLREPNVTTPEQALETIQRSL